MRAATDTSPPALAPFEERLDEVLTRAARVRAAEPLGPDMVSDVDRVVAAAAALRERVRALVVGEADPSDPRLRHDLRTPLNHVLGYGEMLAQEAVEAGRHDLAAELDAIVRAGRFVLKHIDDLVRAVRAATPDVAERRPADAPRRHDDVAVLACELVGFAAWSEAQPAERVAAEMQRIVGAWEEAARRHALLAVGAVAHRLVAVANVGRPVPCPVGAAARCGLDLLDALGGTHAGEARVGVHVGPVVAGALGEGRRDVWGEAVHTAGRVATAGAAGRVTLSEAAWERVMRRPGAAASAVGAVRVDGRSPVTLYRLVALP